jgi:hypothetical protein
MVSNMAKRNVDIDKLLNRCLNLVSIQLKQLEDKEELTTQDAQMLKFYVDISLTVKKDEIRESKEIQKTISQLSDEELALMVSGGSK